MERPLVLVVDRDPAVRAQFRDSLGKQNVVTLGAGTGAETEQILKTRNVDIVLVDVATPGVDAHRIVQRDPNSIVIGLGAESADGGGQFVRAGAFDFASKPLDRDRIELLIERALRQHTVVHDLRRLREELQSREGYHGIVGRSDGMERLRERLESLTASHAPVWFVGEKGTGKELAARSLHGRSHPDGGAFVVLRCAGITSRQWEAQWSGSPGGDLPATPSLADQAEGGSLYLDRLTEMSVDLQARLVEKLDSPAFRSKSGIRLLASSTLELRDAVGRGQLLEELRSRLSGESLSIPPLRDRAVDIPLLAGHFINTICEINHLPPIQLAPEALSALESHSWPENVQELRNAMEQAVILAADGRVREQDLPDRVREASVATPVAGPGKSVASNRRFREAKREVVEAFEHAYLSGLMDRHGGNVTAASQQAGMLRSALQRLLRKHNLKSAEFRRKHRAARARQESSRAQAD